MLLNCGVGEDSWESLGLQGGPTSPSWRRSVLGVHWKDWCWSWNSNPLATSCEELTHWKRPWCWERFRAGGKGTTEDEMVGWHHWLDGHGFGWTPAVGDGQGGLVCYGSWGRKELFMTEWLYWTETETSEDERVFVWESSQVTITSNSLKQINKKQSFTKSKLTFPWAIHMCLRVHKTTVHG